MLQEGQADSALDAAALRLDRAMALLESRLGGLAEAAKAEGGGLFDEDRAKLAHELDEARGRERELKDAGEQAARALDRAIAEIRQVLGEDRAESAGGEF